MFNKIAESIKGQFKLQTRIEIALVAVAAFLGLNGILMAIIVGSWGSALLASVSLVGAAALLYASPITEYVSRKLREWGE